MHKNYSRKIKRLSCNIKLVIYIKINNLYIKINII